ncbi:MAG: hypothetical protein QN172_02570 [Armatimonadota bacterium]|nr:hypothetical protein [Armatimonadota bacterium]MDR7439662.1 hypothetical protein [Armatimonadota bacterium]MDR7601324.1 hypothetical protein [Armatimonadota bacterium]
MDVIVSASSAVECAVQHRGSLSTQTLSYHAFYVTANGLAQFHLAILLA